MTKKSGKSLKEKRAAKHAKAAVRPSLVYRDSISPQEALSRNDFPSAFAVQCTRPV